MKTSRRRTSIALIVAIALVGITAVALTLFSVLHYRTERERQMARLRADQEILANHLSVSLALPIWNFDRAQIDRIIESGLQSQAVYAIVVSVADASHTKHGRSRDAKWHVIPIASEPLEGEFIVATRTVSANGEIVGVVKTFATPKYTEAELDENSRQWILGIVALDAFLILCLYLLLWRLVLNPIKTLDRHAAAVSAGDSSDAAPQGIRFHGELEALRESLDKMIHLLNGRHAAVQESEERYRTVVESLPVGITVTVDEQVVFANQSFLRSRATTLDKILGRSIIDLMPHEYRDISRRRIQDVAATGAPAPPMELEIPRSDGQIRIIESQGIRIFFDGKPAVMNFVQDLTGRRIAERERKEIGREFQELAGQLMRVQDEEHRRIGRELHDSTGQTLAALEINLGMLSRRLSSSGGKNGELVDESMRLAGQCSEEIRTMSYLLHPPLLDEIGLASALRWYADGFAKRSGVKVTVTLPQDERQRFSAEMELSLFRVVQEALTNIHRHSESETASIRLDVNEREIRLEIADSGVGLEPEELRLFREGHSNLGVGISGMRERIRQLGGELLVESDGGGARVCVRVDASAHRQAQV